MLQVEVTHMSGKEVKQSPPEKPRYEGASNNMIVTETTISAD